VGRWQDGGRTVSPAHDVAGRRPPQIPFRDGHGPASRRAGPLPQACELPMITRESSVGPGRSGDPNRAATRPTPPLASSPTVMSGAAIAPALRSEERRVGKEG